MLAVTVSTVAAVGRGPRLAASLRFSSKDMATLPSSDRASLQVRGRPPLDRTCKPIDSG
jgi:hypothetical protein